MAHRQVYLDIAIASEPVGRITLGLYGNAAPTTVSNFLKVVDKQAQGTSYDYSQVWRVVKVRVSTASSWGKRACGRPEPACWSPRVCLAVMMGQGKCVDMGRVNGGGGKKLERKINERWA
jgi:hypothetical protein